MVRVISQLLDDTPGEIPGPRAADLVSWTRAGLEQLRDHLERRLVAGALVRSLARRDADTAAHCGRVVKFGELLAGRLGLVGRAREELRLACLLHDLGKLHVPLQVLHKPGSLDDGEWELMRAHAEGGARIVAASLSPGVARIVGQHHERMDGNGYPHGLRAGAIALEARVVAVADAFDAMTSDRPYRAAFDPEEALDELRRSAGLRGGRGGQFDPDVVLAFESCFGDAARLCAGRAA